MQLLFQLQKTYYENMYVFADSREGHNNIKKIENCK